MIARYLCGASCLAMLLAGEATAQPLAQPSADAASASGLEEIVVTARRKEEKLQSVPIAVTAFTGADLQAHQITDQFHLAQTVPSLVIYESGIRDNASFAIRGQSSNFNGSAGVLTYFNEVPSAISVVGSYYDLENVQILKGPQGTLFGGTSTGGAALFETVKPKNTFEGYGQITLGAYNWREFEGAVNVPIVADKVLLRVAGDWDERDGYTKDVGLVPVIQRAIKFTNGPYYVSQEGKDYDNRNDQHVRVSLLLRPVDEIENLLVARYDYKHTNGPGQNVYLFNPDAFTPGHLLGGLAPFAPAFAAEIAQQAALGPRHTSYDAPQLHMDELWQLVDQFRWDATDYLTVRNIASYSENRSLLRWDEDGTPFPFLEQVGTAPKTLATITEEFQLQGRWFDGALHTTVGFFGEFKHNPNGLLETNDYLPMPNAFFGQLAAPSTTAEHQHAGYGQGTYDLSRIASFLDGVKFTGGIRYTWDDTAGSGTTLVSPYPPFGFFNPAAPTPVTHGNPNCFTGAKGCFTPINNSFSSSSHLGWTIQLEDQIDATTFVYVRAGKAFKPGGVNSNAAPSQALFQSEYLQDVEIGLKKDWAFGGMKARTNIALFHGDYSNIQRSLLGIGADGKSPVGLTLNVGDGTIEGIEFEGALFPGYGLEFDVTYANTQSGYDTFASPELEAALHGVGFPFTPKNKYSVTGRYHLPVPEDVGDISVAATYSYQSRYDVGLTNITSTFPYLPSSGLLDVQIDWNDLFGQTVDATAFMTNATNQAVAVGQQDFYAQLGIISRTYSEPRMWGVRLKYRFGGTQAPETPEPAAYVSPPVIAPAMPKSYLVFFDFNKSDLTPQAKDIVDTAAKNASAAKITQLTVTGHTDTVGSDAYNMRLSRRRAESVAAQLERDGIPSSEIAIVAKGKRDLLVPTGDGVREPQNRRVQIVYGQPVS